MWQAVRPGWASWGVREAAAWFAVVFFFFRLGLGDFLYGVEVEYVSVKVKC